MDLKEIGLFYQEVGRNFLVISETSSSYRGRRVELRNAEKLQIVVSGWREAMHPTPPLAFSRNLRKNGDVSACQYCQCMSSNVKRDPSRYQDTMK